MQNPWSIYPKKLRINSMMMKKNLERSKLQSIQCQTDTDHTKCKQKQNYSKHQTDKAADQNLQTYKAESHTRKYQDSEENQSQFHKKEKKQQKRYDNNQQEKLKQHKPKQQTFTSNSHYYSDAASSQKIIKIQKLKISSSLSNKYKKKVILVSRNPSISNFESDRQELKMIKVLNLYPKKEAEILKCKKATVMQRYDFLSQNMRLAQKLLSMKPTRPCDKKEQKRFFKKQQYFKQLRSYSMNCNQSMDRSQIRGVSQSVSLPKINGRYHTVEC